MIINYSKDVRTFCHPFTANPGLNMDMNGKSPVEFFRLFFTPELIFNETTRYAEQQLKTFLIPIHMPETTRDQ